MKNNIFGKITGLMLASLFVLTFWGTSAYAHYPWINLADYTPETGSTLKLNVGWGHNYPFAGFLKEDSIETLKLTGPGKTAPGLKFISDIEIESDEAISNQGVYIISAKRKSGFYTKTTQGGKRFSKKNLKNVIKCSFSHMCMKAIVNVGDGKGKVDTRVGHPMEIIPLKNPAGLRSGDYMSVQVLCNGKPFSGYIYATYAGFSTEKETFAYATKTDKKGRGAIKILQPGIWLIKAGHEEPYPNQSECDVESFIATLTFEVR